jgi:hypothetical protein
MLAKLNLIKPLVVGGAVAAAIAVTPVAAAEAFAAGPAMTVAAPTHVVFKQDPGGGGCDANGIAAPVANSTVLEAVRVGKAASRVSAAAPAASSRVRAACRVVRAVFRASVAAPATADLQPNS